jgi:hypothetical protein
MVCDELVLACEIRFFNSERGRLGDGERFRQGFRQSFPTKLPTKFRGWVAAKACRKGLRMNFFWDLALACEALPDLA